MIPTLGVRAARPQAKAFGGVVPKHTRFTMEESPSQGQEPQSSGPKRRKLTAGTGDNNNNNNKKKKAETAMDRSPNKAAASVAATMKTPPAPPLPPDPRRYLALWKRYGKGGVELPPREYVGTADDADAAAATRVTNAAASPPKSDVRAWERELELSRYHGHIFSQMDERHARISEHRRQIKALETEVAELQWELDRSTVLPRLYRNDGAFWNEAVPSAVRYDEDLAWRILRPYDGRSIDRDDRSVPVPYQKMLWMEPHCPLRANRDILLASLDVGLSAEIEIVWSDEMKNDRELVKKCFATAPNCIRFEDDDDDENARSGSLPSRYLNDMEMLRAFAFLRWVRGARPDFSPALIHDPEFLADLIVHRCHTESTGSWGDEIVERAFPAGVQPSRQPLLDSAQFALHLAAGMKCVPAQDRSKCPVSYTMLSPRLQESLEVATAFLRLNGYHMAQVPPALRSNEELWRVAAQTNPGIVYCKWFDPTLCPNLVASKDLALLLVEHMKADPWNYCLCECFAEYFPTFPPEIRNDREVNVQLVLPKGYDKSTKLHNHLAPECTHNRDFWLHMAESRKCPCSLWSAVPAAVAGDASIVLAWARHARPDLSDVA
jgi:hypothetical protein